MRSLIPGVLCALVATSSGSSLGTYDRAEPRYAWVLHVQESLPAEYVLSNAARLCSSCPVSGSGSNETQVQPKGSGYLPSGFYDALENPISEKEYWHQVEFEQKHGIPYTRDKESERRRLHVPLSVSLFTTQGCEGDRVQHVTERDHCYACAGGRSYWVESLPSDCELTTYVDEACTADPFACNWGIDGPQGCFTTDAFESMKAATRELPP